MVLIDLSGIVVASLMAQLSEDRTQTVNEGLVRHLVLNNLRACIKRFKNDHKEIVICCDNKNYWRREVYPYYKANRKKAREAQTLVDWGVVFSIMAKIKLELAEVLPHKVLDVESAEADDIIAVLCMLKSPHGPVLIASNDKDFVQLQRLPNVSQWSNMFKKYIKCDDPVATLKEHIIRGDRGDGIPNILSPDDSFVTGSRQRPINSKKLETWLNQEPEVFCDTDSTLRWFRRNEMLIDLTKIPEHIKTAIVRAYENTPVGSKNKMLNYFITNKLMNLVSVLDEF